MADRAQVASELMERVQDMFWRRGLTANDRVRALPGGAGARQEAMEARLLAPNRDRIGSVRALVSVPQDASDAATVEIRWARRAYGFWFVKRVVIGPVEDAYEADLAEVGMVLTGVGWAAAGSVPLRSLIRMFPKEKRRADVAVPEVA